MIKTIKIFIILLLSAIIVPPVFFYYQLSKAQGRDNKDLIFVIDKGETVRAIGEKLAKMNLIDSNFIFETHVWLSGTRAKFQAGTYALNTGYSIKEITDILTSGRAQSKEKSITIIEGWTIVDIDNYLNDNQLTEKNSFIRRAKSSLSAWNFDFNPPAFLTDAPKNASLEGYLFPDTYRIFGDSQSDEIIRKMLDNFDEKLTPQMRDDIKKQKKTIFEIVTMASLIEKEVRSYEDMKVVSGIFWNRIAAGQALQSCATLAYILGINKKQYSLEDTMIVSPYNTYRHPGLPPGPIANPGLNAIKAAIYPIDTDYNFFLSRLDNGQTVFSKSLDEHNRNKALYLK